MDSLIDMSTTLGHFRQYVCLFADGDVDIWSTNAIQHDTLTLYRCNDGPA